TGTLVLTGTSSVANYQAALRSVTYSNTNAAATFGGRTILFKVSDGTDESAQVSRVVNVVLPPPTLSSVSLPTQANNSVGVSIVPTIRWYSVWGAASYTVELSDDPTFATTILDTTIIHTGHPAFHSYKFHYNERLSNSTLYYWRVKANHANALYSSSFSGSWNIITITPANPYLTHPVNGAILSGNTTSFYWYSGQVGVKYLFYISSDPAFPGGGATIFADTTTNNTITVNNSLFTQGATYYWMVIAKTITVGVPGVVIDYSNPWQFSMPGLPQVVGYYPTGGVTIYNNPPTLYWYSLGYNPKVTEYIVRYRRAGSAMLGPVYGGNSLSNTQGIFSTTNINTFSAIPFALDGGYQYFWQVASRDGGTALDNTSYSPEESFFVYGNPTFIVCYPTYPSGGATTYTATPTFYWYPSVYSPVMYYQLQINEDATFTNAAEVTQTAIPTSSYTITGGQASALTAGTTYYWRVRGSLDGTNWGSWSTGASFVHSSTTTAASIATPYPVSPTSGTVVGVTNPTLTWSVYSADPLQFMVTWATNPAFTGDTFTSEVDHSGWMSSNSFVLNGLTAGATYYWQVKARLATTLVEGAWSTVAWFTTAAGSASVVPVAGSPVNGTPINSTTAVLSWLLPTKSTSALKYDVQYSKTADFSNAQAIRSLEKENIEIKNLDKNSVYYWRVSSTTNSGLTSNYSAPTSFNTGKNVTAVEEEVVIPTKFSLEQNYPNPFNPTTLISYALPSNSFVTLKVYDMLGREIKTLVSKEVAAGSYSVNWNGDDNFGNKVSTGAYVYRITAGDFVSVKKMLLIK
ncbi:MAG: FlgD immunoglobulin-like domain containing protein, partial [Melioribacteraceae bacterium]